MIFVGSGQETSKGDSEGRMTALWVCRKSERDALPFSKTN
jgi:hypothetical protein